MSEAKQRRSAAGAAPGAGIRYQSRVAAWLAVHALAEDAAEAPWDVRSAVESVSCETGEAVDDVFAGTSERGRLYVQAKRRLDLSKRPKSDLASALDQCVRQFLDARACALKDREAALDPSRDRLVIAAGPRSARTITVGLRDVVRRLGSLPAGEPFDRAVTNQDEGTARDVLLEHVRRSWTAAAGAAPGDTELREFSRLLRVDALSVEDDEAEERRAKDLLRSLLEDPDQADAAWRTLAEHCEGLIASRSGADRHGLQRVLLEAGIRVRAPRGYREDIERLRRHSAGILTRLADYAAIRLGRAHIEIDRPYAVALRSAAEEGSMLLVGEPGAGKSGVIHGLARALAAEGRDVVVFTVQDPPFASLGELRDELRLEHDVADVLANWPGDGPAFLLIDALDAARTDAAAQALRQLMRAVMEAAGRWRVVASIREYDVRYGRDVRRLFAGDPPQGRCPRLSGKEFAHVRHLVVGSLTRSELDQLAAKSPPLHELVSTAPSALEGLFTNIFNLRLAAELLDAGTEPEAIRSVGSQLDLLDLYWDERVVAGGERREADAREAVLRRAVEGMVRDRSLRVDRDRAADDPAASPALADLLRAHMLTEWTPASGSTPDRSTLTFAHHVLFDYAVARLLLRRRPQRLAELLAADPAMVLLARPSLVMHFHYAWDSGASDGARRPFWEVVLAASGTAGIPEIGKLVGPSTAAASACSLGEFEPLLEALTAVDEGTREAAENAFTHMVGSLIAARETGSSPVEARVDVWCALTKRVSRRLQEGTAYPVRALLADLTDRAAHLAPGSLAGASAASRRLLEFAWRRVPYDRRLAVSALQFVCRTFGGEPDASAALLRRAIELAHLAAHGSDELLWIADEVEDLLSRDAALVRDIYVAAFGYRETSDAPAPMGGIVMPMVSNRRQDYNGALHRLERAFPGFLERSPEDAILAMNSAVEAHVARERTPAEQQTESRFDFCGTEARILPDYSCVWDRGSAYPHEDAVKLLDHLESRLNRLAGPEGNREERQRLLGLVVREVRLAGIWRRLLRLGARNPDTLGLELRPLAWATPLLAGMDTSARAGELIRAITPLLPAEDRERIEKAILALPSLSGSESLERSEKARDRLLGCLGDAEPVTEEARDRLTALREAEAVPANEEPIRWSGWTGRDFGEVEFLAEEGVPVQAEPNRRIRELEAPVEQFSSRFLNSEPDADSVAEILPHFRALWERLRTATADGVHPRQAEYAWGILARGCGTATSARDLPCSAEAGALVRDILLEASLHPGPGPDPESDASFEDFPHWGSPSPRVEAAQGLMSLAFDPSCADNSVLDAIERLSGDPVPAVRYQIALMLNGLLRSAPERCWILLERIASADPSRGVLNGLLQGPLFALRNYDPERVAASVLRIYAQIEEGPGAKQVHEECVNLLIGIYLSRDLEPVRQLVEEIADHPLDHLDAASHLAVQFREVLTDGPIDGSEPEADAGRARAVDLVLRLTRSAARVFREGAETDGRKAPDARPADISEEQLKSLAHLLDSIGFDLYFASGAHDDEEEVPPESGVQERLLREAGPVIDVLADVGLPSLTHHLLETLEVLVPFDPRGVFMRVAAAIRGGRKGGYQYDSMAERVLVRVVQRYLADYRAVFQADEAARLALVEVLDTFVRAGSSGAHRLSYGLEGIFH
ncbi:MAG: hypothetical protein AB1941_00355 [Gemmatimonadota bacterium]